MICWEESDVFQTHGLKDVLLEVVIEREARDTFDQYSCPVGNSVKSVRVAYFVLLPVNVDSIFPSRTWLIDQRLRKDIKIISRKLI